MDADSGPLRYVSALKVWWYLSPARHFYSHWLWPYCAMLDTTMLLEMKKNRPH